MATFFGRPVNELLWSVAVSSAISLVTGAATGYAKGIYRGDEDPTQRAKRTAKEWVIADAVIETGLGIFAPNIRSGGMVRSALVSSAIGGASGFIEGYGAAKLHHADDPAHHGMMTAAEWAAIDAGIELSANSIFPGLREFVRKG